MGTVQKGARLMRLVITSRARRDIDRLDKETAKRIQTALDKMLINPHSVDLKKLEGSVNLWRLRVGDWRVILRIEKEEITAYALQVSHRREVYRK